MLDMRMERYVSGGTEFRCLIDDNWYWVNVQHGVPTATATPIGAGAELYNLTYEAVVHYHVAALRHEGLLKEEENAR